MADKLNISASIIIKAAGRTTRKDSFILITENEEDLIQTNSVARFYILMV
jgi:hypothetical protein